MKDDIDIFSFVNNANKEVNQTTVTLKKVSPNVYKKKQNYKIIKQAIKITITALTTITVMTGMMTAQSGEEAVAHKGDTVGNGGVVSHYHKLTKEDFMRDFLYLNPGASDEDIINALYNGEFEYYLENEGLVKQHPKFTVFQFKENSRERYNGEVVEHIDDLMEEYGIEESHGKSK